MQYLSFISKRSVTKLLYLLSGVLILSLIVSVILSGYFYMFDNDELSHAQMIYLLAHGDKPFLSFFSIYSPIFHWVLLPVFTFFGFSIQTIQLARAVMIGFFIIRIVFFYLSFKMLFGKKIALLFIPFYLLDPFTIFSSMQIRPDNLMMMIFSIGFFCLTYGSENKKKRFIFLGGLGVSLAILISIKMLPIFIVLLLGFIGYCIKKRLSVSASVFFLGVLIPILFFLFYFFIQGSAKEMYQQLFVDSKITNDALLVPVPLGNYYWPNNLYLYGSPGKPLPWFYVWILPLAAFIGLYKVVIDFFSKSKIIWIDTFKFVLCAALIIQWLSLFFISSVYMQYYIPITWLFALFAAVTLDDVFHTSFGNTSLKFLMSIGIFLIFCVFTWGSIQANVKRSEMRGKEALDAITKRWQQIPENEDVFPALLFRRSSYPLIYGYYIGDIPQTIINRFPSVPETLGQKKIKNVLVSDYNMIYLTSGTKEYIGKNYHRVIGDGEWWIRN